MLEKKVFSIIFVVFLLAFSGLSMVNTYPELIKDFECLKEESGAVSTADKLKEKISLVEDDVSKQIYRRYDWIEAYGTINRLIGKKEINCFDYAIDQTGSYVPINFWSAARDISFRTFAQQLVLLRDEVEKRGGHFTFLLFPNKQNEDWNVGYAGIPYNNFNDQADVFLNWLQFYGVDFIDFRETLKNSGLSYEEMFYRTDHHWTGKASFAAFKELVKFMNNKYDADLDLGGFYTDECNYEFDTVENSFLGASGRDVGYSYANMGLDDFSKVSPRFENDYKWTSSFDSKVRKNLFYEDALTYTELYKSDLYRYYLLGVNERDQIENLDNPDGPKAFMIRDSFASPLITQMAPLFSEIDASWGKYTSDRYVKNDVVEGNYDYVFVAYYTEDLYSEFFKFYEDDVEEFKLKYAKSQGYLEGE